MLREDVELDPNWSKKLLVFLDTEFSGLDQAKPDLISIGLVDELGREFYAELPESHWTVQCNEWVHFNVLPHLWGGSHVQSEALIRERLTAWIESIPEDVVIVTDWPQGDFFTQLKRLLPKWPKNLNTWPTQFGAWSIGDEQEPELRKVIDDYHIPQRPRHHALHDAHSLRLALMYAVEQGWRPSVGGDLATEAVIRAAKSIGETLRAVDGLKGALRGADAPISIKTMNQAVLDGVRADYGKE